MNRITSFGIAVTAALLLAGCTAPDEENGDTASGADTAVEVGDDYFEVAGQPGSNNGEATADVGETFVFTNEGERPHTVTIHRPPDPVDVTLIDEDLQPGDETTFTFDQAGTYHAWCRYHGEMTSGMAMAVSAS